MKPHLNKAHVVFVPGYYGSSLVDRETKETLWVSVPEVLFGSKTLALEVPGVRIPGSLNLSAGQLIEQIDLAGNIVSIPAYGTVVKSLATISGGDPARIHSVPYDWRKDPRSATLLIDQKISALQAADPQCEIHLVSHSYGALICAYYLRYGTQDYFTAKENWHGMKRVQKVVMAAAPFRGTLGMFRNMCHGLQAGLNANLLSGLAYSTFPSGYFFLPPEEDCIFIKRRKIVRLPLWDIELWQKNKWGLFQENPQLNCVDPQAMKAFVSLWLASAQKFQELNLKRSQSPPPKTPTLYLQGIGARTSHHGFWLKTGLQKKKDAFIFYDRDFVRWAPYIDWPESNSIFADGDAVITHHSSNLPQALHVKEIQVIKAKLSHLDLLRDDRQQTPLREFLS